MPEWQPMVMKVQQVHCSWVAVFVLTFIMDQSNGFNQGQEMFVAHPFHFGCLWIQFTSALLANHWIHHRNSARSLRICNKYSRASFGSMSSYIIMTAVTGEIRPADILAIMSSRWARISSGVNGML